MNKRGPEATGGGRATASTCRSDSESANTNAKTCNNLASAMTRIDRYLGTGTQTKVRPHSQLSPYHINEYINKRKYWTKPE
eukprot:475403-Amphidinium_carterae.2